jgi:hypothetical protein
MDVPKKNINKEPPFPKKEKAVLFYISAMSSDVSSPVSGEITSPCTGVPGGRRGWFLMT